MPEVTSKHMKGVTELTVIANIKPGLVDVRETLSYATRLRILLRTLHTIRQKEVEEAVDSSFMGPLERLQVLHFVRWSILEADRKLLLAVSFDGPWEPYIRKIADRAGALLDVILCNCEGYEGHATDRGFQGFAEWVRERQVACEFFFAGEPGTSVDDVRYLKKLEEAQRRQENATVFDEEAARLKVLDPSAEASRIVPDPRVLLEQGLRALRALYSLAELYPNPADAHDLGRDHLFLLRTARMILDPIPFHQASELIPKTYLRALQWLLDSPDPERAEEISKQELPKQQLPKQPATIQGNILEPYEGMTHGCLLLMRCGERVAARTFLKQLEVTGSKGSANDGEIKLNIGFTYAGLRALGMTDAELAKLPQEFREGMEARAGWLGDVGPNHPERWKLPKANWPPTPAEAARLDVRLSSVDLVIVLQTQTEFRNRDHLWSEQHPLYPTVRELVSRGGVELLAVEPLRRC